MRYTLYWQTGKTAHSRKFKTKTEAQQFAAWVRAQGANNIVIGSK